MARIENRIRALDAELRNKAPQYFAIVKQPALGVKEAQALLRPDEAALLIVPSRFGTHVMAVTREGLVWHRADMKAEDVAAKVARLRQDLDPSNPPPLVPPGTQDSGPSFDRRTACELYAALIAPVAASLEGKSHVFIAADGALASLPFGVLVTEPPAPGTSDSDAQVLRQAPWFAGAHALIQIPSLHRSPTCAPTLLRRVSAAIATAVRLRALAIRCWATARRAVRAALPCCRPMQPGWLGAG